MPALTKRTPYISSPTPNNGTVSVALNSNISFKILTDVLLRTVNINTIDVFVNQEKVVSLGVPVVSPLYTTTVSVSGSGYQVDIDPISDLATQTYRVRAYATDSASVAGEGYFEFSTDNFDYILQINPYTPLECLYDTVPDPYRTTNNVSAPSMYLSKLSSPTAYWSATGSVPYDIINIKTGATSGEFIVKEPLTEDVSTYERPRSAVSGMTIGGYRRRRFSSYNPAKATSNSAVTYPLTKMWGDTAMRYLAGHPSITDFPVDFVVQPLATTHTRSDVSNVGILDDVMLHPTTELHIAKQNYLNFSISSYGVAGANYDRYALPVTAIPTLVVGTRTVFQFSFTSMDDVSEVYFGLGNNPGVPSSDGTNRSGVTLRRVGNSMFLIVYHGTTTSSVQSLGISYNNFINKLWVGELEIVSAGSLSFSIYDFEKDLVNPITTKTVLGGGSVATNIFTVTSLGNDCASGIRATGSLYYVDIEAPVVPGVYALGGNVGLSDAKWRPYANIFPMTFSSTAGLKYIQAKAHMPEGAESSVFSEYHVIDTEPAVSNIDSLTPETLVEVLAAEDSSIANASSANSNMYRRATFSYETYDQLWGILFLSKVAGPTGDLRSVTVLKPGPSTALSITLTPTPAPFIEVLHITVILATDGSGNITTTLQQLVDAVEANSDSPVSATPVGMATHLAEAYAQSYLTGGVEYKVSSGSRFNELTMKLRSNKTGTYYVSMNDTNNFGRFAGASLATDGTFITATPIFQPTDIGKTINISNAANSSNAGLYTIVVVLNSTSREYPTNTVMLNRSDFIAETNTFTWFLESRGYLLASGFYPRINNAQTVSMLTQDFNNLSDGTRTINVSVCKNMLIATTGILLYTDSTLVLNN